MSTDFSCNSNQRSVKTDAEGNIKVHVHFQNVKTSLQRALESMQLDQVAKKEDAVTPKKWLLVERTLSSWTLLTEKTSST